ncbi:long-chain-fatty-acid--CoA ligase [Cumulibacter manganitolerans]|uniref:long-chain-fatty-acid--CoA ligase n=1 Tax=Cumulibacter manganitolerans TaxID=1884992 RepID=UPI00129686DB|nr:long-chain-fatty-acid--CoA ligase [Cumulibacter manganitolerans]
MTAERQPSADLDIPVAEGARGEPLRNIAGILRQRRGLTDDVVALKETDTSLTYGELDERSSRLAQALRADGVQPGDRVAIFSANNHYFMELVFGAAKIGAIAAPINTRLARNEVLALMGTCEPKVLFVGEAEKPAAPAQDEVPGLARLLDAASYEEYIAGQPAEDPGYEAAPDEVAVLLFSSGTTGLPKGIPLSGQNFSSNMSVEVDDAYEGHVIAMAPVPFFHVTGLTSALTSMNKGSTLILRLPTSPQDMMNLLLEEKVTHAVGVPTIIQMLTQLPGAKDADWSHLHSFGYGGAPMPLPVIHAAHEVLGCELVQGYGLTETTAAVTALWPEDHHPSPGRERQVGSVGKPLPGVELKIVDPATRQEVPTGQRGEVWVRGSRVTSGYWNRPEENAKAFTEDGWFATGDGGSLDEEGYLYLHDRIKDMIVTGAENVYPAEVESVLSGHPGIAEVAVIGIPSEKWGESPYAIAVRRPGSDVTAEEIISWCRDQIAHYKCPVDVAFVDVLPRNPNGKLLKRVLREQYGDHQAPV